MKSRLLWLGVAVVVAFAFQLCTVEGLTFLYEFPYSDSWPKNPQVGDAIVTIGAEGMAVENGPGGVPVRYFPRFSLLSL